MRRGTYPSAASERIKRDGFTLVELIAVVVITAVIAATALPALHNITDTRATLAAKQLLQDLTLARQQAVATGTRTWVAFDLILETWSVLEEDPLNPGRGNASIVNDPATGQPFVEILNAGSFIGIEMISANFDADAEIGFDWLGQPLNASEVPLAAQGTVVLTGNHVINVAALTGHITYVAP